MLPASEDYFLSPLGIEIYNLLSDYRGLEVYVEDFEAEIPYRGYPDKFRSNLFLNIRMVRKQISEMEIIKDVWKEGNIIGWRLLPKENNESQSEEPDHLDGPRIPTDSERNLLLSGYNEFVFRRNRR